MSAEPIDPHGDDGQPPDEPSELTYDGIHSDPEPDDGAPASKKSPSEKQLAANRANAERSTGPRTEAGKAVASMNRLTHGLHASREVAITRGTFREEHLEVMDFLQEIIASLQPRDAQELLQARRVAMCYLWNERLDRYQTAAVQGDAMLSRSTLTALGDPAEIDYHDAILEVLAELFEDLP